MFIIQVKDRRRFLECSSTSKQFCVFQSFVRVVRCQLAYLNHNKKPADLSVSAGAAIGLAGVLNSIVTKPCKKDALSMWESIVTYTHSPRMFDLMALQRLLHQKVVQLTTVASDCFFTNFFKSSSHKK